MITPITGQRFLEGCGHVLDKKGYRRQPGRPDEWWFVKTNCLSQFVSRYLPLISEPARLLTHNSDLAVDDRLPGAREVLAHPLITSWWSTNVALEHPKLRSAPLGLGCPNWPYGDMEAFGEVLRAPRVKDRLLHSAFRVDSNKAERRLCVQYAGPTDPRKPYPEYLRDVARSYFVASPEGEGIDCHRTWEALYLGAVPIVTDCLNVRFHLEFPILLIKSWKQFPSLELSPKLHEVMTRGFDPSRLDVGAYFDRMKARG